MAKVLLADKLPAECIERLESAGIEVVNRPGMSPEELKVAVCEVDGVIVRSGATLTADILDATGTLKAAVRAGVGVDNIDIAAASRKGIVVMNTPGANTISTAEHTFALMLALARNVGPAYASMREGKWDRKKFMGAELAGMTLGVIGLGRVGQEVARRAVAFEMKVIGSDPFITRNAASKLGVTLIDSIDEVLEACDYLTVHVPGGDSTKGMIGETQIAKMKPTARIINCARGSVVDMAAVVQAVDEGRLAGAAFDVYTSEPPEDFAFAKSDKILSTPHLGASTEAAQIAVGIQAASQMVEALLKKEYRNALNVAHVAPEEMAALEPYCDLAFRMGKALGALTTGRPDSLQVLCAGDVASHDPKPVVDHAVMGLLQSALGEAVNIVSAPHVAAERGLAVTSSTSAAQAEGFADLVVLQLTTDTGTQEVAGTVFGRLHPRIVRVGGYYAEILPEGEMMLVFAEDKPGLIGSIGDALGEAGINIARMTFGREAAGGAAMLALNLDTACSDEALAKVSSLPLVNRTVRVAL